MKVLDVFRLDGKVALVTGATSGIGWAYAEAMAEAGADVACVGRNEARLNQALEMVKGLGRRGVAIKADVSKEADVIRMTEHAVAELGKLDIVFANAGILYEPEPLLEGSLERWQRVIDINLTGAYLTLREAAKVMALQKHGKMISTSSIIAIVASPKGTSPAYTAAKAGVISMTKTFAVAMAPYGIQVNSIAPGFIKTPLDAGQFGKQVMMGDELDEESKRILQDRLERTPMGRFGEPAELKGLAVFLASAASDFMTGVTIPIDGGWIAW